MSETDMTNQDLENIRAVAPKWAGWCVTGQMGGIWFQESIPPRGLNFVSGGGRFEDVTPGYWGFRDLVADGYTYAIDLTTGAIHVQHAGKIVVVTLAEWSAEE